MDQVSLAKAVTQERRTLSPAEITYGVLLFVGALGALVYEYPRAGGVLVEQSASVAFFFLVYGLFTISIGYKHPTVGHYSFDRVSQVASLLVFGPFDAAWINGLASFLYPWHRLLKGVPFRQVLVASVHNAGLMALIIYLSGKAYLGLGGEIPLAGLDLRLAVLAVVLVLCMQLLNDLGMLVLVWLRGRSLKDFFQWFSITLELGSGATAVLVALTFMLMPIEVFALLLIVLSVGMLAMRQFATMRYELELIVQDRTRSLEEKTRALERQAKQDNLTGLFNRRYADEFLQNVLDTAARNNQPFAVVLGDIDFFKRVNDEHSHATGDEVLKLVAHTLRARCRKTDMIARYGGEEFLICFPETDILQARWLCEELRIAIESADWAPLGVVGGVTISFGVAEYAPNATVQSLLGAADKRLYAAKNNGRNLVVA
jgi:diguanylate cyclase (GGDEF)-like protein